MEALEIIRNLKEDLRYEIENRQPKGLTEYPTLQRRLDQDLAIVEKADDFYKLHYRK